MNENFDGIIDKFIESNSTKAALLVLQEAFELEFTTFHLLVNPSDKLDNPFVRTTYPDAWVTHYLMNNYVTIDPVIQRALHDPESFDWEELTLTPDARVVFKAASEFGIGQSGYSFVYEDPRKRRGLLTINSSKERAKWKRFIEPRLDSFETLLPMIHAKAVAETSAEANGAPRLTPREHECLQFSSEGKSYSEIAIILSISEHTVRSYLKMARVKLDCVTLAQAVAKAVRLRVL